ncbi:MAG: FtsQ-type POTRA domain-containing protein [Candidatus Omnitrophica bacterium]|nr:FtsQ-type POTRA domain-containing protein [Candidatus Omnitrophota bacterium]
MREKLIEEKKKKIRKYMYFFILLLVCCLIIFAKIVVPRWFKNLSIFSLKNVVIEPSDYASFLKEYLSLPEGVSLFKIDMAEIYSQLKQVYFVEDCKIEKHLPDTLVIKLKIRTPWVIITDDGSHAIIDRNGYFLAPVENFIGWNIEGIKVQPVGTMTDEKEKIEVLKEIEQWYNYYGIGNSFKVDKISLKDLDKIQLMSGDTSIYIHKEGIDKQLETAKKVLDICDKNNFSFEYIDVRFKEPYIKEKQLKKDE